MSLLTYSQEDEIHERRTYLVILFQIGSLNLLFFSIFLLSVERVKLKVNKNRRKTSNAPIVRRDYHQNAAI